MVPAARAAARSAGPISVPVSMRTPSRRHSASSQSGQQGQPFPARGAGRGAQRPAGALAALGDPDPVAPAREHPGRFQAGRAAADHEHVPGHAGHGPPRADPRSRGRCAGRRRSSPGGYAGHGPGRPGCTAGRAGPARDGPGAACRPGRRRRSGPGSSPPGRSRRRPARPARRPGVGHAALQHHRDRAVQRVPDLPREGGVEHRRGVPVGPVGARPSRGRRAPRPAGPASG